MADPVAARYAMHVAGKHAGLIRWMKEAELSSVTPAPQRRHAFDDRDADRVTHITGTHDPDDAMITLIDRRLAQGADPERLDPVRQRMTAKLGELAGWYGQHELVDVAEWEPLATRLGDLIGDQVAANALALCCIRHARLATGDEKAQTKRKNARDRWYRLAGWYVRVLDEQPTKEPTTRVAIQSVDQSGERTIGYGEGERRSG